MRNLPLVFLIALVGCTDQTPRDSAGREQWKPVEVCLNGVVYYDMPYTVTPKLHRDGTVETCGAPP